MNICLFGHLIAGSNLILTPGGRRKCRLCNRRYRARCARQRERLFLLALADTLARIGERMKYAYHS